MEEYLNGTPSGHMARPSVLHAEVRTDSWAISDTRRAEVAEPRSSRTEPQRYLEVPRVLFLTQDHGAVDPLTHF